MTQIAKNGLIHAISAPYSTPSLKLLCKIAIQMKFRNPPGIKSAESVQKFSTGVLILVYRTLKWPYFNSKTGVFLVRNVGWIC